ncbi:homocysteine S-methyltransferase family protein [Candidatus Peregrinibacteria bacterium]|nr:MAG: homocysteine S-methyltransferase family protein [Candidatus Peregrinibacteria bacterium]
MSPHSSLRILSPAYGPLLAAIDPNLNDPLSILDERSPQLTGALRTIIHRVLEAGASTLATPTFGLRKLVESDYQLFGDALRRHSELLLECADPGVADFWLDFGPKSDCYRADLAPSRAEARDFHALQINAVDDLIYEQLLFETIPALHEAEGIALALKQADLTGVISFVLSPEGTLLCGTPLYDAINTIDRLTGNYQGLSFSMNCCSLAGAQLALQGCAQAGNAHRLTAFYPNATETPPWEIEESCATGTEYTPPVHEDPRARVAEILYLLSQFRTSIRTIGFCCGGTVETTREFSRQCFCLGCATMAAA